MASEETPVGDPERTPDDGRPSGETEAPAVPNGQAGATPAAAGEAVVSVERLDPAGEAVLDRLDALGGRLDGWFAGLHEQLVLGFGHLQEVSQLQEERAKLLA